MSTPTRDESDTAPYLVRFIRGIDRHGPPTWLMRQAGRYLPEYRALRAETSGFLELCLTPDKAMEATLQPIRRFGFDAAILFSDILTLPYAAGQDVRFVEGEGPRLGPIEPGLEGLKTMPDGLSRLAPVYETVTRVRAALPAETALIGFAAAPWTLACYMVGGGGDREFVRVRLEALRSPDWFADLLRLIADATAAHLLRQIEAGADVVQLFDSWAGLVPADRIAGWVIDPTRRIVESVRAVHPDVPMIGFPRGAGLHLETYAVRTGVDVVGLDSTVPAAWAREALQGSVLVQGNLDPLALIAGGEALDDGIDHLLDAVDRHRLVFNLGHGVRPETPIANVERLVERVRRFRS